MKRSLVTFALGVALSVMGVGALAQEHGQEEGHGDGEHAVTEGFHAPAAPFNLANPSPPPVMEGGHETKGPPPFIGPLINFAILVVLGYMAVQRQVNPALAARRAAVETEIAEAKRLLAEAEAAHRECTERRDNLQTEVAGMKAEYVKQGEAERDRIVAEANARAEKMRAEGKQMIEQEMRSLREELRREAVLAAVGAAEEAVRKNVSPADQVRLVDEFVQSIEAEARNTSGGARA